MPVDDVVHTSGENVGARTEHMVAMRGKQFRGALPRHKAQSMRGSDIASVLQLSEKGQRRYVRPMIHRFRRWQRDSSESKGG